MASGSWERLNGCALDADSNCRQTMAESEFHRETHSAIEWLGQRCRSVVRRDRVTCCQAYAEWSQGHLANGCGSAREDWWLTSAPVDLRYRSDWCAAEHWAFGHCAGCALANRSLFVDCRRFRGVRSAGSGSFESLHLPPNFAGIQSETPSFRVIHGPANWSWFPQVFLIGSRGLKMVTANRLEHH